MIVRLTARASTPMTINVTFITGPYRYFDRAALGLFGIIPAKARATGARAKGGDRRGRITYPGEPSDGRVDDLPAQEGARLRNDATRDALRIETLGRRDLVL